MVKKCETRSESRRVTKPAYSAKYLAVSRDCHPPTVLAGPAAGPNGTAWHTARCPRPAARPPGARSRRCPSRWVAGAIRKHARPGDRETVGLHAQRFHELDVLRVAMVLVHRDIAGVSHGDACRAGARRCPRPRACVRLPGRRLPPGRRRWRIPRGKSPESGSNPWSWPVAAGGGEAPWPPVPGPPRRTGWRNVRRVGCMGNSQDIRKSPKIVLAPARRGDILAQTNQFGFHASV